jgi:hypothetical protein
MPSAIIAEADPLKADFRNFLFLVWAHLNLPPPTPLQYDIAKYLQHGPRRGIIMALRGIGKSWITIAFVAWLLYCNPQVRVLVVSASAKHASDFTTMLLGLINEMPLLSHLKPRGDQRASRLSFDVGPAKTEKAPSVQCLGITGQLTGCRADWIIPDDIETATNSDTQAARDKLVEIVKEFGNIIKPGGRIMYLGTPHNEDSLYNKLAAEREYVIRIWPARFPTPDKIEKYGHKLAPYILQMLEKDPSLGAAKYGVDGNLGQGTDVRFNEADLIERELENGRTGFALQFMLDTSLTDAERFPLRLSDLIVLPLDPFRGPASLAWGSSSNLIINDLPNVGIAPDRYHAPSFVSGGEYAEYQGSVMFIDPSGKGKDETSYAVVKMLNGWLYLTAAGGFLGGYTDPVLKGLLNVARRQDVNHILCEPNFGGGMFAQLLRAAASNFHPCEIEDSKWAKGQKETRIIDTLEPIIGRHRLVVCRSVIEDDFRSTDKYHASDISRRRLFFQMTRITRDRGALAHDDRIEAVAGAVAYWQTVMNKSTDDALADHRESAIELELAKFMEHAIGGTGDSQPGTHRPRPWASATMQGRSWH